jgi:hypothetical protein
MRVAVPNGDNGVPAVQIEVLFAVVVPHKAVFAFYGGNIEQWINVE